MGKGNEKNYKKRSRGQVSIFIRTSKKLTLISSGTLEITLSKEPETVYRSESMVDFFFVSKC